MKILKLLLFLAKKQIWLLVETIYIAAKKHEARQLHRQTGKRYWVLRDANGDIEVYSRLELKNSKIPINKLLEGAIYRIG